MTHVIACVALSALISLALGCALPAGEEPDQQATVIGGSTDPDMTALEGLRSSDVLTAAATDGSMIYVACYGTNRIDRFDASGRKVGVLSLDPVLSDAPVTVFWMTIASDNSLQVGTGAGVLTYDSNDRFVAQNRWTHGDFYRQYIPNADKYWSIGAQRIALRDSARTIVEFERNLCGALWTGFGRCAVARDGSVAVAVTSAQGVERATSICLLGSDGQCLGAFRAIFADGVQLAYDGLRVAFNGADGNLHVCDLTGAMISKLPAAGGAVEGYTHLCMVDGALWAFPRKGTYFMKYRLKP